jgi:Flp pilus assembly protein TadD
MAEVEIRTGQADIALPVMNQLLAADPSDPRAHEMAGKARLMLGDFSEARQHFSVASTSYSRDADVRRSQDLGALAEGFEAYAQGRVALAEDVWASIADPHLRAEVMGASGGPGAPTDDETLARSIQSNR